VGGDARHRLRELTHTDCLIAVGTRFDDRLTGGIDTFAPEAEVIHVDIDPAEISKNVHADYPLVGDAGRVLDQLTAAVRDAPDAGAWRDRCEEWKETYPLTYATPDDEPLKPQFVVEAFDEATDDDTVVTTGVGQHQMWASQFWSYTEPRTWVSSHGLGTMGYGVPAAVGARVAADTMGEEDRDVVCFDGDGSFLMTMQELSVAVREELDITVAVLNNEYIGMVRQWQDAFYEGRHMASDYTWMPEFDKLAEAFGALGLRVDDYDEVAPAVEEALAYEGPAVIDFHVDPEENVLPMVPSGGANGKFAAAEDQAATPPASTASRARPPRRTPDRSPANSPAPKTASTPRGGGTSKGSGSTRSSRPNRSPAARSSRRSWRTNPACSRASPGSSPGGSSTSRA